MSRPSISIILPTFNRESLLHRAIRSVVLQDFPSWELIVVDDGSDDDTSSLLEQCCTRDTRIRPVNESHQGPVSARYAGIAHAQGDYITFLDSDDFYLPHHLRLQHEYISHTPHADGIRSNPLIIGSHSVSNVLDPTSTIPIDECAVQGTFFFRNYIFDSIPRLPEIPYAEDYFLLESVTRNGFYIEKIPTRTYVYVRGSDDARTGNIR